MLSGQGGGTHLCTTTWKPYIETEEERSRNKRVIVSSQLSHCMV